MNSRKRLKDANELIYWKHDRHIETLTKSLSKAPIWSNKGTVVHEITKQEPDCAEVLYDVVKMALFGSKSQPRKNNYIHIGNLCRVTEDQ